MVDLILTRDQVETLAGLDSEAKEITTVINAVDISGMDIRLLSEGQPAFGGLPAIITLRSDYKDWDAVLTVVKEAAATRLAVIASEMSALGVKVEN